MGGEVFGADDLGVGAEGHQMKHVLGKLGLDQTVERQRHLLAGVQASFISME